MDFKNGVSRSNSGVLDWDSPSTKTGTVKRRPISHGEISSTSAKAELSTTEDLSVTTSDLEVCEKKADIINKPCIAQLKSQSVANKTTKSEKFRLSMGNTKSKNGINNNNTQGKSATKMPIKYSKVENKTQDITLNKKLRRKDENFQIFDRGKLKNSYKYESKVSTSNKKTDKSCQKEVKINLKYPKIEKTSNNIKDVTQTKPKEFDNKIDCSKICDTKNARMLNKRTLEWVKLDSEQKFNRIKDEDEMNHNTISDKGISGTSDEGLIFHTKIKNRGAASNVSSAKICESLVSVSRMYLFYYVPRVYSRLREI